MERPKTSHIIKPWGSFSQFTFNQVSTVKILTCEPGQELSLQRHQHRSELWVALDQGACVEIDQIKLSPKVGEEIWIAAGVVHRLSCSSEQKNPVRILEISLGNFDEHDIERLQDRYGR